MWRSDLHPSGQVGVATKPDGRRQPANVSRHTKAVEVIVLYDGPLENRVERVFLRIFVVNV